MKKRSRILFLFLSVMMVFCLAAPLSADPLALDNVAPAGFDETTNPYGYKEGDPFPLLTKDELVFFGGSGGSRHTGLKNADSTEELDDFTRNPKNDSSGMSYGVPEGKFSFVQSVAFDADGDGSQNYMFFIGMRYYNNAYHAYGWVVDMASADRYVIAVYDIGDMGWISGGYNQYNSASLFDITAGDYNGDQIETVVVSVPLNYNSKDYSGVRLCEFQLNAETNELTLLTSSYRNLMRNYHGDPMDKDSSWDTARNKLVVAMATGDYNGDFIDDLAVLSYHHVMTDSSVDIAYYDPVLNVIHGRESVANIADDYANRFYLQTKSGGTITFPMACSLVAGDWDNDNDDDLCVVGLNGSASYSGSNVSGGVSVDDTKWYVQRIFCDGYDTIVEGARKVDANEWFEDGCYTDENVYGRVMAEAVAINGETNADMLFISGSLFDISGDAPVYLGQNGYFGSGDEGLDWHTATNTFMQSTTVGNFIGDPIGREQVFYTIGMKRTGHNEYYYLCGYVSGKDYNDTETSYGVAGGYHFSDVDDDSDYIYEDEDARFDYGLNCIVAAVDSDNDSVYAKYIGKQYAYSDPTVSMVLQAAPYFSEVSGPGSNWTEYVLTTIYGNGDIGSDELGASVGVTASAGLPGVANLELTLQYAASKTDSWEESKTTTTSQSFVATAYDTVVVNRIPVFIYQYDILDESGKWQNGAVMELMSPRPAVYESLSVDDYNAFAKEYNDRMATKGGDFYRLEIIDKEENYLDNNEGNPYAYQQHGWGDSSVNATQISSAPVSLGKNNALGRVSWDEENTRTDSWEITGGVHFDFTSRFGPEFFGVGPSGSIDYNHGYGETTTTGTAVGASCIVQDIDGPGLIAQGVPSSVVNSFGFDWTLGRWERHLSGEPDSKTPFVGYALSNVTSPPLSVNDLSANLVAANEIELTWSKPQTHPGWPEIDGYYVYAVDDFGNYSKVSELLSADTESVSMKGLAPFTEYTYVVTTMHRNGGTEYESIWSNEASATTMQEKYKLTYGSEDANVSFDVRNFRGMTVESGESLYAGSLITLYAVTDSADSSITAIRIARAGTSKVTTIEPMADGSVAMCRFLMTADTTVTVLTDKVVSAEVSYKADYITEGQTIGTVSATANGAALPASSSKVSSPVTFTATPAAGYILKAWKVTADNVTSTVPATENNPYTLTLEKNSYYVEAVFAFSGADDRVIMLDYNKEGGKVLLTDAEGNAFALSADFSGIVVPVGTEVTVKAVPEEGYTFVGWAGDAADKEGAEFTLSVTENMLIKANFEANRHRVTYQVISDTESGFIVSDPYVSSGAYVNEGSTLNFTVGAEEGYRIDEITVTNGDQKKVFAYPDDYKTMVSGSITVAADVNITAKISLCVCEKYDDISLDDWFHNAAVFAIDHGLMKGMTETTFAPYDYATRAQIVTILYRMAGEPDVKGDSPFDDVAKDSWYGDAVIWAASEGIAKGMSADIFAPDEFITREQMVTFFYRYSEWEGYSVSGRADLSGFPDADDVSEYALDAMSWAVAEGLIRGDNYGKLLPQDRANRAQIATILERYVKTQTK